MKKTFLSLVVTTGLIGTLMTPQLTYAVSGSQKIEQQLNDLKKKISASQQKATTAQNEINKVQKDKQQVEADLKVLQKQIEDSNVKLNTLNDQIFNTKAELKDIGQQVDEVEAQIEARDALLKSRLRLMYMNGVVSYTDVLLNATSFGDFLDRLYALKSIASQDKKILEDNQHDRAVKVEKEAQSQKKLADLSDLYGQQSATNADLQQKDKEKHVLIASLDKKQKEQEEITEDEEANMIAFAKQQSTLMAAKRKQEADEAAARAAAAKAKSGSGGGPLITPSFAGGKFGYPLPKLAVMSSDYGYRSDPFTGAKKLHKGIDLAMPNGTDILAAGDGVVIVASWWSGYGNTVIIDHGGGYWTLYGHIRNGGTVVEKGDTVKRGQKIAEVGSTGESTGNHLHFEVRVNSEPVDPKPYLR
ncbi:murein hydrolase activator EnvC family protein [Paenibacillus rigui]|uniref:Peptidase M23 n=1 Tax=Paenibacillus rigui TaxID=554312 RepID=A0A229USE8_9BACL|nr:M23 family metallopeptidase [Paenibacillus rigui]OXM86332.1 peptidase M23 [Paenibacillus rigui]